MPLTSHEDTVLDGDGDALVGLQREAVRSPTIWDSRGALLLTVSPAPPVASRGHTSHSSPDSLLFQLVALIKVGLPGSVCLYLWATSFSACFSCPCYLPGSPLSPEHLCLPNTASDLSEAGPGYPTPAAPLGVSSGHLCGEGQGWEGQHKRQEGAHLLLQMVPHATHWLSV